MKSSKRVFYTNIITYTDSIDAMHAFIIYGVRLLGIIKSYTLYRLKS